MTRFIMVAVMVGAMLVAAAPGFAADKPPCPKAPAKVAKAQSETQAPRSLAGARQNEAVQAPRGNQDVQSPRGNQDVQAPRANENVQSPRGNQSVQSPRANQDVQSPRADCIK